MKVSVTRIRDLNVVLKDLERYVKAPAFLYRGRPFKNFGLRPREVLANWLICAVANFETADAHFTFSTDPLGGDGVILNQKDKSIFLTEHVFIPKLTTTSTKTIEELLIDRVEHKNSKGAPYALGKQLVVFSDTPGLWYPNRLSRRIAGAHHFDSVWILHFSRTIQDRYIYSVALLDTSGGNAPVWSVDIAADFKGWKTSRIQ